MSKYLETPSDVFTRKTMFKSLQSYVIDELKPFIDRTRPQEYLDDNGEKITQKCIDDSDHRLRMYGTAKELAENMRIYRDFPESHRYFENIDDELYFASAVLYENLKGQKFISRQDVYIVLQNMALAIFPNSKSEPMRLSILGPLTRDEKKVPLLLEFVKFEEKVFEEIEMGMQKAAEFCVTTDSQLSEIRRELTKGNYKWFHDKLLQFDSEVFEEMSRMFLINRLEMCCVEQGPAKGALWFAQLFNENIIINCLESSMKKCAKWFEQKKKGQPATVRLFEDGGQKFVMKAELFGAMNRSFKEEPHLFTTMSWEEVEKMKNIGNIEFLLTPIHRAKHRPVAVKGHVPGEFGYLAIDALLDIMKTLTIGSKLFQRAKLFDLQDLIDYFGEAEPFFNPDKKTPYFVRQTAVKFFIGNFKKLLDLTAKKSAEKDVRNAKRDGFTLQNLKNELAHLELLDVFPEIEEHAEVVYEHVNGVKAEKYLRTCDLYDAVEYCQLICFFNRLPHYKQFIHNQGACPRVPGLQCHFCSGEKEEEKLQAAKALAESEKAKKEPIGAFSASEVLNEQLNEAITITEAPAPASENAQLSQGALSTEKEKLEEALLKKSQENEELRVENIKLAAENEANKRVIEQLLDKFTAINNIHEENHSIPIVTTSTSISECLICDKELDPSAENTIKCPMCRTRFHRNCALNHLKHQKTCPSCMGTLGNLSDNAVSLI